MEENIEIRLKTMKILQELSTDEKNCNQMLSAECASRLVLKINYPQPNDEYELLLLLCFKLKQIVLIYHIFRLLFRSIEILWNLLENGDKKQVAEQLNTMVAISELRESFLQQLLQGFSNYDRQLRLLFH